MMKRMLLGLALALVTMSLHAADAHKDRYAMFPQAEKGYVRYIVEVPKTENDYEHKVELLIGKNMMVDCNHHSFSGKVEKLPLKGWGYSYYKVSDIKSGQKFFSMFFKCNKLIANNGIIIIEKKWICNSPNKVTKNIVKMAVTDNTVRVNLFNFIFCRYNKSPRNGINPIY